MMAAPELAARWGDPDASADGFLAWLRSPHPIATTISDGGGVFVHGAIAHESLAVEALKLTAGGARIEPMAQRMPSPGLAAERGGLRDAGRAIFWGVVPLSDAHGAVELGVVATAGGTAVELALARLEPAIAVTAAPAAIPAADTGTVVVCMATYEPDPQLLERQLESLVAQTHENWICLVSDDASGADAATTIERLAAVDPRIVVSRSSVRRGAYENFGRALSMVPAAAGFVALCDQDDRWYPEKLETLIQALGPARMAFSDMRLTRADGSLIADTYWTSRVPNHDNFASLVLGNSVTGAASLFRRELLEEALPLPPRAGNLYHDHWLAMVAAASGPIAYVDRPLYDYVQHSRAVIGHAGANRGVVGGSVPRRLAALRGRRRGRLRDEWRRIYFGEYCRAALTAVALRRRLGGRIGARQGRALDLIAAADRSPLALAWLTGRQLRRLRRDDTGGSEAGVLRGLLWRRALSIRRARDPLDDADLPPGIVGVEIPVPTAGDAPPP
jgi:glycosyltransferase involved in cell wall biosynthesis